MKKFLVMVVVILFAFAMTSVAFAYPPAEKAAPKAEEKKTEPAKTEKTKQITGEVTAINAAAKALTVKGKKAEVIVTVDEKMLTDVKVGDKVVVKYVEQDGKNVAKSIKKAEAKVDETKADSAKPAEPAKKKKAIEGC